MNNYYRIAVVTNQQHFEHMAHCLSAGNYRRTIRTFTVGCMEYMHIDSTRKCDFTRLMGIEIHDAIFVGQVDKEIEAIVRHVIARGRSRISFI